MHNMVYLIGRLTKNPESKEVGEGKEVCNVTLAVQRGYKNTDGVYETDFVDVEMWNNIASNFTEYCKQGDLVGVKGRIQVDDYETDAGERRKNTRVVADKISFLATSKTHEDENENDVEEENLKTLKCN